MFLGSAPTYKVDYATQNTNGVLKYPHFVDKYVNCIDVGTEGGHVIYTDEGKVAGFSRTEDNSASKAAADFVTDYYSLARNNSIGTNMCSVITSNEMKGLITRYNGLSADVKAIVDGSQDFQHVIADAKAWYEYAPTIMNLGTNLAYIANYNGMSLNGLALNNMIGTESTSTMFVAAIMFAALAACVSLIVFKRKRRHN